MQVQLQERLARLGGGIGVIAVGGTTLPDTNALLYRTAAALHTTYTAIQEGKVIGGGVSLLIAASAVREATWTSESTRAGALSFANALAEPSRALSQSVGSNKIELFLAPVGVNSRAGLNVRTGHVEDLLSAGVLDSAKEIRRAVQIAFAYAREMLMTDVWVAKTDVIASNL